MKLTTNRKQLLTALDMVSGAIEKRSTIPGMVSGVSVGFNAEYLRDFLKSIPKEDEVSISGVALPASSAWAFSVASDPGYTHVVMPFRT